MHSRRACGVCEKSRSRRAGGGRGRYRDIACVPLAAYSARHHLQRQARALQACHSCRGLSTPLPRLSSLIRLVHTVTYKCSHTCREAGRPKRLSKLVPRVVQNSAATELKSFKTAAASCPGGKIACRTGRLPGVCCCSSSKRVLRRHSAVC